MSNVSPSMEPQLHRISESIASLWPMGEGCADYLCRTRRFHADLDLHLPASPLVIGGTFLCGLAFFFCLKVSFSSSERFGAGSRIGRSRPRNVGSLSSLATLTD